MRRLSVALALATTVACAAAPPRHEGLPYYDSADFSPRWSPVAHHVGRFHLTTQMNRAVTDADLRGHPYVASFIFTTCSAICPTLVQNLKRVQEGIADRPDVRLLSYSVTPATDTPAVLDAFGRERGIDPSRWLLVTGDIAQITSLARESYFADDGRASESQLLHTEKVLLVDGEGRLRGIYNGTAALDMVRLIEDIKRLS